MYLNNLIDRTKICDLSKRYIIPLIRRFYDKNENNILLNVFEN